MKLTGSGHAGKEGSAFFIWGTVKQWNSLLAENVEKVSVFTNLQECKNYNPY